YSSSVARSSMLVSLLVAPLARMNVLELERFLDQFRRRIRTAIAPRSHIGIVLVVALSFAIRRLIFLAEVAAARFISIASVDAHQLRQLEEVGHTASLLQALIQIVSAAGNGHVLPIFLTQRANLVDGGLQAFSRAGHAAIIPYDRAQLAME